MVMYAYEVETKEKIKITSDKKKKLQHLHDRTVAFNIPTPGWELTS